MVMDIKLFNSTCCKTIDMWPCISCSCEYVLHAHAGAAAGPFSIALPYLSAHQHLPDAYYSAASGQCWVSSQIKALSWREKGLSWIRANYCCAGLWGVMGIFFFHSSRSVLVLVKKKREGGIHRFPCIQIIMQTNIEIFLTKHNQDTGMHLEMNEIQRWKVQKYVCLLFDFRSRYQGYSNIISDHPVIQSSLCIKE